MPSMLLDQEQGWDLVVGLAFFDVAIIYILEFKNINIWFFSVLNDKVHVFYLGRAIVQEYFKWKEKIVEPL